MGVGESRSDTYSPGREHIYFANGMIVTTNSDDNVIKESKTLGLRLKILRYSARPILHEAGRKALVLSVLIGMVALPVLGGYALYQAAPDIRAFFKRG
jgi:hypothetical protein